MDFKFHAAKIIEDFSQRKKKYAGNFRERNFQIRCKAEKI